MGMDVYGAKPTSSAGEYFRNNVWWWRPLWQYASSLGILTPKQIEMGSYNEGFLIPAATAKRLADAIDAEIAAGRTQTYAAQWKSDLDTLPDETCEFCKGTGERNDAYVKGKCNGCDGKGSRRPFATHYPFSVENAKEFADFARASGGFRIA